MQTKRQSSVAVVGGRARLQVGELAGKGVHGVASLQATELAFLFGVFLCYAEVFMRVACALE